MEYEYPFHVAFLLLLTFITNIRMYYRGFADASSGVRESTKNEGVFRVVRILLGGPVALGFFAYMIWPPWMSWSQLDMPPEARWAGLLIGIAGFAMLLWVHKHLSRNFTGTVQIRPGGHVVKTGPYAYVRHPMYIAFLLLGASFFLLTANWFIGSGFLIIILIVMIVRTPVEERALEKAYGKEYREYKQRTGAVVPRIFG